MTELIQSDAERRQQAEQNVLKMLCMYLLYDRSQESDLRIAFIALVTERHQKFHNADVTYDECRNQICIHAKLLINAAKAPEVLLNAFAIELTKTFSIKYTPAGETAIHAALVRKDSPEFEGKPDIERLIVIP